MMRTRFRQESGQVVVIFALMVLLFAAFGLLVFDLSLAYNQRLRARAAADFAALAAVQELPTDPVLAAQIARDYLLANGFDTDDDDVTVEITTPYQGDSMRIQVSVNRDYGLLLGRGFGIASINVGGAAAAEARTGGPPYAVYSSGTACPTGQEGIKISGQSTTINGPLHSNADFTVSGQEATINGSSTYSCDLTVTGQDPTFNPDPPAEAPVVQPPFNYQFADFPCDYVLGSGNLGGALAPGVYCYDGNISVPGQDTTGKVTLVATGRISISAQDAVLTPYFEGILAFTEDDRNQAISISGQDMDWTGIIVAPNGGIKFTGQSGQTYAGSMIGKSVEIAGQDFILTAYPDGPGSEFIYALTE